ncbi:MAG: hypothetical protein SF182_18830 [Deltaproteobacteria bacterium]|nr:hypothetical protein [Deltaproteobacteria bacterium]
MRTGGRLLLLVLALYASGATAAPRLTRVPLARLPATYIADTLGLTPDARAAVYAERSGDGARVVQRGQAGPTFRAVSAPRVAADGAAFYWATEPHGIALLAGTTRIATPIAQPGPFAFAAARRRWAAVGADPAAAPDSTAVLWVDGRLVNRYPDLTLPVFSRDAAHYAYLGDAGSGLVGLFVDGKRIHLFEPPDVAASPVRRGPTPGTGMDEQYVVTYLSDGQLLLLTTDHEGWAVYRDDQRVASYNRNDAPPADGAPARWDEALRDASAILGGSLISASDAPVIAWWGRDPGLVTRWRVLRDGVPLPQACKQPAYDTPPALSADGRHAAYACTLSQPGQPEQVIVVHDDRRYGPYPGVRGVALSPDGSRVAFATRVGAHDWSYVVDGRRYPARFRATDTPRFSADGRHVAWVGQRLRDGRAPRFVLLLDGNGYASSERALIAPRFDAATGVLHWATARGRRIDRVAIGE